MVATDAPLLDRPWVAVRLRHASMDVSLRVTAHRAAIRRGYNPTTGHVMRKLDVTNLSDKITRLRNLGITDLMLSQACEYIEAGDKPGDALKKVLDGRSLTYEDRVFVLDQLSDYGEFFS
jgi:hypothetical protein